MIEFFHSTKVIFCEMYQADTQKSRLTWGDIHQLEINMTQQKEGYSAVCLSLWWVLQ